MSSEIHQLPTSGGLKDAEAGLEGGDWSPHSNSTLSIAGRLALVVGIFFGGYSLLRFGPINFTLSDLAFLGCALVLVTQGRLNLLPFGSMTPFWLLGLTLMLGGLFVSTVANGDPLRWVIVAAQYLMAFVLLPVVLNSEQTWLTRRLTIFYVLGMTLSQAIGIASFYLLSIDQTYPIFGDGFITGNGRVGAMSGEPSQNGAAIAFAFPMLIYALRKRFISVPVGAACALVMIWGLILCASFTGFIASAVASSIALALMGIRHLIRAVLALSIAGALFVGSGAPLPKAFETRVAGAVSSGDLQQAGTFTDRSELIREAWAFAEDTILLGMGVDRYREVSPHGAPVHTLHLLIWTEGGAVAFLGLLILLALLVLLATMYIRDEREESGLAIGTVVVFLIYTLSIPHMYSRVWVMPVMLALSTLHAKRLRR